MICHILAMSIPTAICVRDLRDALAVAAAFRGAIILDLMQLHCCDHTPMPCLHAVCGAEVRCGGNVIRFLS